MKNKNLIFGIIVGFGAFYLFEKVGKKPCGCQEAKKSDENMGAELLDDAVSSEDSEPTCEEAVAMIMAERRKVSKMSEQAFKLMEQRELEICRNMSK